MTIQEAIKSGKQFRRKGDSLWRFVIRDGVKREGKVAWVIDREVVEMDSVEILATDWEIRE